MRTVHLRTLFDCESLCQMHPEQPDGDPHARAACRCTLPGFDHARWDPDACPDAAREAEQLLSSLVHGAEQQGISLDHDLDRDGCPFGWAASHFSATVAACSSPRDASSPVRSQNALLWLREPRASQHLIKSVQYLEAVEDGAYSRFRALCNRT